MANTPTEIAEILALGDFLEFEDFEDFEPEYLAALDWLEVGR